MLQLYTELALFQSDSTYSKTLPAGISSSQNLWLLHVLQMETAARPDKNLTKTNIVVLRPNAFPKNEMKK